MKYTVKRIQDRNYIEQCEKFQISNYMWDSKMQPKAYGYMGYLDGEGLFVKLVCEEKNPKRIYRNHRDPVYKDSAMEAFLAFSTEGRPTSVDCMYTNFEINANGAMYAAYGIGRKNRKFITDEQYGATGVTSTIGDENWCCEVLFPEAYLKQLCDFEAIKQGKAFYCNFYKIAEDEEILHFGSFSPIENETPNFHMPQYFAEAVIEEV